MAGIWFSNLPGDPKADGARTFCVEADSEIHQRLAGEGEMHVIDDPNAPVVPVVGWGTGGRPVESTPKPAKPKPRKRKKK